MKNILKELVKEEDVGLAYDILSDLEPTDDEIMAEYGRASIDSELERFYLDEDNERIYVKVYQEGKRTFHSEEPNGEPDEYVVFTVYHELKDEAGTYLTYGDFTKMLDEAKLEELN